MKKHTVNLAFSKIANFHPRPLIIKKYMIFLLNLICDIPTEVSIKFCDVAEMKQANFQFRGKDQTTDVLSFIPDFSVEQNLSYLGDILICVPVCIEQAARSKHSLSKELIKMLTHALLHLKGFDHDRNEAAARVMTKLEKALLYELNKVVGQQSLIRD